MYTSAIYKKMIVFFMYAYCANSICSEAKQPFAVYDPDLGKDEIIISFDDGQKKMVALDSPVGLCLEQRSSQFYFRKNDFSKFIASFRDLQKREYLTQNETEIFQYNTIEYLGSFFDYIKNNNYAIRTNDYGEIKKALNALFMFTFLQRNKMFNNSLIMNKEYSDNLIRFSNNLLNGLLHKEDFLNPGVFFLSKMLN